MIHIQIPSLKCCFSERKWQFSVIDQWLPVFSSFVWLRIYLYGNPLFILPLNAVFLIFFLSNCLKSNYLIVIEKCICFWLVKYHTETLDVNRKNVKGRVASFEQSFSFDGKCWWWLWRHVSWPLWSKEKEKGKKAWVQEIKLRLLIWFFIKRKENCVV